MTNILCSASNEAEHRILFAVVTLLDGGLHTVPRGSQMSKTPKELYEERDGRINDAIELRIPDRIPLNLSFGYFPASYTGTSFKNAWYDCDAWLDVTDRKSVV